MSTTAPRRIVVAIVCAFVAWIVAGRVPSHAALPVPSAFSFGILADVQYRDAPPQGARFYRESLPKLQRAVQVFNAMRPAFVIQLGDLIDGHFASFDPLLPVYNRLTAPHYHVLGNHDVEVESEHQMKVLARLGLNRLGAGKGYYDFRRSGWRFVVLNGEDLSVQAWPQGSPERAASEAMLEKLKAAKAPNATAWNGGVGPDQLAWLKRVLAAAGAARERVIVFCHFPVAPAGDSTLWNSQDVVAALESSPSVAAYFCAHKHAGDYVAANGIHYVNLQGMVEGSETAYAVVDLSADSMLVRGFGREQSRRLALRVIR